jgi:hypothetical protein
MCWGATDQGSVAVDGINPTLALAALLFGMSGNPQDTTHQSAMNVQVQEPTACAVVADVANPGQLPPIGDPIVRHAVPAASTGTVAEGCPPKR